MSTYLYLRYIR